MIEELKPLYAACPFCAKVELKVSKILPNNQLKDMIRWFERQRAFRANVEKVELPWQEQENTEKEQNIVPIEDVNMALEDLEAAKADIQAVKDRPTQINLQPQPTYPAD